MATPRVYLSRRNLLTLLSKLDRQADGEMTACTLIKSDNTHAKYPQTMKTIEVTAVEDEDYYVDRPSGDIHASDEAVVDPVEKHAAATELRLKCNVPLMYARKALLICKGDAVAAEAYLADRKNWSYSII